MSDSNFFNDILSSIDFVNFLINNKKQVENFQENDKEQYFSKLPVLKITNVLYPCGYLFFLLDNPVDIQLIQDAMTTTSNICVVCIKNDKEIYNIGTVANIIKIMELSEGKFQILLRGFRKIKITKLDDVQGKLYQIAEAESVQEEKCSVDSSKYKAVFQSIKDATSKLIEVHPNLPNDIRLFLSNNENFNVLTYFLASGLNEKFQVKQKILETNNCIKRGLLLLKYLYKNIEVIELQKKIKDQVQKKINGNQKDFFIKQQINMLKDELDEGPNDNDIELLRQKGEKMKWNKKVAQAFEKDLSHAEKLTPNSSDYAILINHAELMLDLPWNVYTKDNIDLEYASKILNKDHYGMEKVKDRILEYLAVIKLKSMNVSGQILCLYGPPGVGKTSLCKSIAKAMNRNFVKIALGGIQDEAEIRGHRKTYIGAMPGRIIKGLQQTKSANAIFLLDEIDKLINNHGDPAAALLEVLDPNQNDNFVDHFLEVPFDLSKIFFIATANRLDTIPKPLKDRLEILEVSGYALEEKVEIAKQHIIPTIKTKYGIKSRQLSFDDDIIAFIINRYTRESGVRDLERQISAITRKVARKIVEKQSYNKNINVDSVHDFLGIEKVDHDESQQHQIPGIGIGLAWTPVGGDILFIESVLTKGSGKVTLSGQLGDVMKESTMTAYTYLKSHAHEYNINDKLFSLYDVYVHVPDGATPKDGPSAGITMFTTLLSLFTQRKIKDNIAMTGEITLRGKVLPVGGIKEKVLAAKRANITDIIMCLDNQKDVNEIKKNYIEGIDFHYIKYASEIADIALQNEKYEFAINFDERIKEIEDHKLNSKNA